MPPAAAAAPPSAIEVGNIGLGAGAAGDGGPTFATPGPGLETPRQPPARGRERPSPPEGAQESGSPASKRGRAGGDETPAACRGVLDFGSTPVAAPASSRRGAQGGGAAADPLPTPAELDAQPAAPEDPGPSAASGQGTPPRPPALSGRPREDKTTPPAPVGQARKRHRAPAARQGLSFAAPAPSEAPGPGPSWRGYRIWLEIMWRVSSNATGLEAATSAVRHHLGNFASRQGLGCCVEGREHADRIELFVEGINERAVPGDAALGLPKQLHDALKNVARSANKKVSQCHFAVRIRDKTIQLDSDVLERIHGIVPPRDGFRSWYKRRPTPAPAPPAPAQAPAASNQTPGEVALALGVDLSNLRSGFHAAASTKDLESCCSQALSMLEILHKYISGVEATPAPAVSGTRISTNVCRVSSLRTLTECSFQLAQQPRPCATPQCNTPSTQQLVGSAPPPLRPRGRLPDAVLLPAVGHGRRRNGRRGGGGGAPAADGPGSTPPAAGHVAGGSPTTPPPAAGSPREGHTAGAPGAGQPPSPGAYPRCGRLHYLTCCVALNRARCWRRRRGRWQGSCCCRLSPFRCPSRYACIIPHSSSMSLT